LFGRDSYKAIKILPDRTDYSTWRGLCQTNMWYFVFVKKSNLCLKKWKLLMWDLLHHKTSPLSIQGSL